MQNSSNQPNSQFWGTGIELLEIRNSLDPIGAKGLVETLGRRLFGLKFDYSLVEFRGLNLPVTIVDNETGISFMVTPYQHLITEDGYGNSV